jgi:hypothetical protein
MMTTIKDVIRSLKETNYFINFLHDNGYDDIIDFFSNLDGADFCYQLTRNNKCFIRTTSNKSPNHFTLSLNFHYFKESKLLIYDGIYFQ